MLFSTFKRLIFIPLLYLTVSSSSASPTAREIDEFDFIKNLFRDQRYEYVLEEAQQFLKQFPQSQFGDQIHFYLAQAETQKDQIKQAIQQYQIILQKYPKSRYIEDSLYYLGLLLIKNDHETEGREHLVQLKKRFPNSTYLKKAAFTMGQLAFRQKKWQEARHWFETAIKNSATRPEQKLEARRYLAWSHYFEGNQEEAYKWFIILLNVNISTAYKAEICYQLAIDTQKKGNPDKAIFWYKRQQNEFPDPRYQNISRFWITELTFQHYQNNLDKLTPETRQTLIQSYSHNLQTAAPIEPAISLYHRALLFYQQNDLSLADADFDNLQKNFREYQNDSDLTLLRADINFKLKKWPVALKQIQHLFTLRPEKAKDPLILFNLGQIHDVLAQSSNLSDLEKKYPQIKTKQYHQQQALQFYEKAYQHSSTADQEKKLALLNLIIEKIKIQQDFKALAFYYQEALPFIDQAKDRAQLQLEIGKLFLNHLQNKPTAKEWLSKIKLKDDRNTYCESHFLLGELYIAEKKYDKAVQILKTTATNIQPGIWYYEIHYRLAELLHFQEKWQQALKHYDIIAQAPAKTAHRAEATQAAKQIRNYLNALKKQRGKS